MVPGPDVQRAFCSRHRRTCCGLQGLGDRPGVALQLPGLGMTAAGPGLACCDQQRSVQHRHRLGRAHGEVKVRDRMLGLGPLGHPDQLKVPVRGERMRGLMGGHGRVHPLLHGPVLRPLTRVQALPVRPHPVHVQGLEDGRVHLAPEAELGRRLAAPLARRLPGRVRVVLRPARVPGGLALGQVPRVVTLGQRGDSWSLSVTPCHHVGLMHVCEPQTIPRIACSEHYKRTCVHRAASVTSAGWSAMVGVRAS